MAIATNILQCLIPISQFNKGQASKIFDRLHDEKELIVLKNNQPSAVILSPEEYTRLTEIEEDYYLLIEATKRIEDNGNKETVSMDYVMRNLGIDEKELENAEDIDIENPLPVSQGGYGKPLGNKENTNLTNLMKIKFRDIGIRVVYKIEYVDEVMKIIVISARTDEQVYKEASKRRKEHNI